jgi:hypothetical protein
MFAFQPPSDPTPTPYVFPEEDLLHSLIELYFTHLNIFYPLLHRPTFDKSVEEGLHLSDDIFAESVLLVCAVGSRYSDDPRVLLSDRTHSRGWKWFSQMQGARQSVVRGSTVDDLRFYFVRCYIIMKHIQLKLLLSFSSVFGNLSSGVFCAPVLLVIR